MGNADEASDEFIKEQERAQESGGAIESIFPCASHVTDGCGAAPCGCEIDLVVVV